MDVIYAADKGIYLVIMLSLLPVSVATVVGLTVGLLQTVTQIQEQTLPFGLKLIAVFVCILMQLSWLGIRCSVMPVKCSHWRSAQQRQVSSRVVILRLHDLFRTRC